MLATKADVNRLGYVGSQVRSASDVENDDWYTPRWVIALASEALGGIDLDPFSSEKANETVMAARYFTALDDARTKSWRTGRKRNSAAYKNRVFMNPPYSRGLCSEAVNKLLLEIDNGNVTDAVVLVNNMTDTKWFRSMADKADRYCFFTGRIGFVNAAGQTVSGNTRGQVLFLFSKDRRAISRFIKALRKADQLTVKNTVR